MKKSFLEWKIEILIGAGFSVVPFLLFLWLRMPNIYKTSVALTPWLICIFPILLFIIGGALAVHLRKIDSLSESVYEGFLIGMVGSIVYYLLIIGDAFLLAQIPLNYESLFIFFAVTVMVAPLLIGGVIGGFLGFLVTKLNM